jgi:digeranylgeranylglycerophospholipid reductase
MKNVSDVIVVGGGPCGSFTAANLARNGVNTSVFEEHGEIGVPSHCAGHLGIKGLRNLNLYPLPDGIVENTFCGAVFHSPSDKEFVVRFSSPVTCVVNRTLLDKHLAAVAEKAGVRYCLNSRVESVVVESGVVKGVTVRHEGKSEMHLAKIIIDAEGISSRVLKQAGLSPLSRRGVVNAVSAEVENVEDVDQDMVEVYLGQEYASGFYAWLIPKPDGKANIGLAAKTGNPKELLQKFVHKHPAASKKLRVARFLRTNYHPITLGGPITSTFSDGLLVVGDAASQVKPTTGGGVVFGLTCAREAADVACEALRRGVFSSAFLGEYQKRCDRILGFDLKVMKRMRMMLDKMSDRKLDEAVKYCKMLSLENVLRNFWDIDSQGQSFLRILYNPRILSAGLLFFFLYLSANP